MTAMRQRMSGLAPHLDGYSMYGSVGQVGLVPFHEGYFII